MLKSITFVLLAMTNLSTASAQHQISRSELIESYRAILRDSPKNLVHYLKDNDEYKAAMTAKGLYYTWEALFRDSQLFDEKLRREVCGDGWMFLCRNVVDLSGEYIRGLYFGDKSHSARLQLAEKILENSYLE